MKGAREIQVDSLALFFGSKLLASKQFEQLKSVYERNGMLEMLDCQALEEVCKPEESCIQGLMLYETQQFRDACLSFFSCRDFIFEDTRLLYFLVDSLIEAKRHSCAGGLLKSEHGKSLHSTDRTFLLVKLKERQGDYLNALKILHEFGKSEKLDSEMAFMRGRLLFAAGEKEKAYEAFKISSLSNGLKTTPEDMDSLWPVSSLTSKGIISKDVLHASIDGLDKCLRIRNEVFVFDNFLSSSCLEYIHQKLNVPETWGIQGYKGYKGTALGKGLESRIVLEMGDAIRDRFRDHLNGLPITHTWAFMQTKAQGGISLHADVSAYSVNIWLTPDRFNLNKSSGGLVFYDYVVPETWDFGQYNVDTRKLEKEINGVRTVKCTYRFNRAILFKSRIVHHSDNPQFVDTSEGRRINMTFLYGRG